MKEKFPKIIREVVLEVVCWLLSAIATFAIILLLTVVVAGIAGVAIIFITEPNWSIVLLSVIVVISILVTELLKYNDETNNKH